MTSLRLRCRSTSTHPARRARRPRRPRRPGPRAVLLEHVIPKASHQPLTDRSPVAPSSGRDAWSKGSRRFRLRRCRRPIRFVRGQESGMYSGPSRRGLVPQRGRSGQDQLGSPEYIPPHRICGPPNTVLLRVPGCSPTVLVSRQRHRGISSLPRLVGAPRPPLGAPTNRRAGHWPWDRSCRPPSPLPATDPGACCDPGVLTRSDGSGGGWEPVTADGP